MAVCQRVDTVSANFGLQQLFILKDPKLFWIYVLNDQNNFYQLIFVRLAGMHLTKTAHPMGP